MAWKIKEGILIDHHSYKIGTLSDSIDPYYIKLIQKTPEITLAFEDYLKAYEQMSEGPRKKISKKLHDGLLNLVDPNKEYNFEWNLDANGDLIDEKGKKLCVFFDASLPEPVLMKFVPNILKAIKEELPFTGNNAKQKPLYEKFSKIYSDRNLF